MTDPLRVHQYPLRDGIRPTSEFAKKKLAQFSVNIEVKCGHGWTYCSSDCSMWGARRAHYASMASGGVLRHCGIGYDFLYFESTDPSYKEDTE